MAVAVVNTDIDSFIREQKAKLASERSALNESDEQPTRRQWDKKAGLQAPLAVQEGRPQTQESGLPLNNHQALKKQQELARQRQLEYNQLIKQTNKGPRAAPQHDRDDDEISNPSIIPFNRAQEVKEKRRHMEEERQREYQQMKAKLEESHRRGRAIANSKAQQAAISGQPQRGPDRGSLLEQTDEYKAKLPGTNDSDLAKAEKEKQRNEEYNQFLRENESRRTRAPDQEGDGEFFASLPGLRDSHSAKVRKEQQRNREYNEFLASRSSQRNVSRPLPAPRKGWGTPTYEDILEKKREEERQYRRANDPDYAQPLDPDTRLRLDSRESDTDRDMLGSGRASKLIQEYREVLSRLHDFSHPAKNRQPLDSSRLASPPRNVSPPQQPSRTREAAREKPSDYYATLPIGQVSEEAQRRQKEQYRQDLLKQMKEVQEGRKREKRSKMNINFSGEKDQDKKVDLSGFQDPGEGKAPTLNIKSRRPPPAPTRATEQSAAHNNDGLDRLDHLSSRLGSRAPRFTTTGAGMLDTPFSLSRGKGEGLLDTGFASLLDHPSRMTRLAPPPDLQYQPVSFITQGGSGLGHTSVLDAYDFFAAHDLLDGDIPVARMGGGGGGVGGGGGGPRQMTQDKSPYTSRDEGGGGGGRGERGGGGGGAPRDRVGGGGLAHGNRVRFEDERPRKPATMDFPSDEDKKREAQRKAQAYQEELSRQIEEKKRKKLLEKEEIERYEKKLEQEAQTYNPYGRGGGGAPTRDAYGNIITDLRAMRRDANNPDSARNAPPHHYQVPSRFQTGTYSPSAPVAVGSRDDLFGPPPVQTTADGEQTHARGGHGIFGLPKTTEEKVASEKYKEELRRQIEQQKIEQLRQKQMEREEEEREERRLEEERRKMQLEYEEEQRKVRAKEEEARKKNEELLRQAEERKKEVLRKRKEEEEKSLEEERRKREAEMNARLAAARDPSPPVPATRTKAVDSEPLPSTSKEDAAPASRAASANVLNQLAVMRRQLQNERQRVEDLLQTEKKAPDVFDPRLMHKPPHARPEVDVFETARQGNAVAVRRTPADRANQEAMEDFNALRHKEDSDSRKEFRKLFPDQPSSADALEAQQAAMIRQQEQQLRALRERRERGEPSFAPKPSFPLSSPRGQTRTPQQLTSNSAFVDADGLNYFPDDFDDMKNNHRNESARTRRRYRQDSNPRAISRAVDHDPFGSSTSLNVDRLSRKNEERLKRLRELQGDDLSLYDPKDVLDRFMSKQSQHRPPSGQTLQDDSWLMTGPASKASY